MDFDEAESYYGDLVDGFLSDQLMTVDQAVACFVEPIRAAYVDDGADPDDIDDMLWAAWPPVIEAAKTRPDTQDRLVGLLSGISAQGTLTRGPDSQVCVILGNRRAFTDLPCFGAQMREELDIVADENLPHHDPAHRENYLAFAARLTAVGIDFTRFAVWTFRECVESDPVDFTLFRIWHRFGGSGLVRGLTEMAEPAVSQVGPVAATVREAGEARAALRLIATLDHER